MSWCGSRLGWGRQLLALAGVCLGGLVVVACGGSSGSHTQTAAAHTAHAHVVAAARTTPCQAQARDAMATFLSIAPAMISTSASMGTNGMPQCSFKARLVAGKRVGAVANVDNGPQPYFRLERTALEASQTFGTPRLSPAPEAVLHLGLEADWFPAYPQLMATDGKVLITLAVTWNRVPQSRQRQLAVAMTRTYLHTPHGKAAEALANGYASG
jgi:hypothetical protein